jgi:hypothetical protein
MLEAVDGDLLAVDILEAEDAVYALEINHNFDAHGGDAPAADAFVRDPPQGAERCVGSLRGEASARRPFAQFSDDERALLRAAPLPERIEFMKAVLTEERFSDPAWLFERKLDGIRCMAIKGGGEVRLLSRNDLSLNARFPEIAAALAADPVTDIVLDGEIVAFSAGQTSFERLRRRAERHAAVYIYAFGLLYLAGHDMTRLPLHARRRLLRSAVDFQRPPPYDSQPEARGRAILRRRLQAGLEGLIAKRADAPYTHGRSRETGSRSSAPPSRSSWSADSPTRALVVATSARSWWGISRMAAFATQARSELALARRRWRIWRRASHRSVATPHRSPTSFANRT